MTNRELALSIRHRLFAERDTVKDAMDYAFSVFRTLGSNEAIATTAMMVVLNTISREILENENTTQDIGC